MGKDSLPGKESGRSAKDNRKFMAAVMWIVEHLGAAEYGKWSNKRFMRWARAGVWQMIFWQLYRMIDSTEHISTQLVEKKMWKPVNKNRN